MNDIFTVTFHDKDQQLTQQLCFHDELSAADIRGFISASFKCPEREIVGIYDNDTGVYFPLSMVANQMSLFTSGVFTLVYHSDYNEPIQADSDVAEQRNAKAFDFISATMKIPLDFVDAYIRIIIDEVRSHTSIKLFKIGVILQAVSQFSGPSNDIGKAKFIASMNYLSQSSDSGEDAVPNDEATYGRIFDSLCRGGATKVNVFRLCRFLSLFSGGLPNENVKMLFFLFDFDRDGTVSAGDVFNCFRDCLHVFSDLYRDVFTLADACRLDDVAKLLTISVFRAADAPASALSLESFYQWYSSRFSEDGDEHILFSSHLVNELGITDTVGFRQNEITVESVAEARSILGFQRIEPVTLKECLANYCEPSNPQFISKQGVFCAIILAARVHSVDIFHRDTSESSKSTDREAMGQRMRGLLEVELLVLQLFTVFDSLKSGYVDRDEIFCGLSPLCGGTWVDRVTAMFISQATKQRPVLDKKVTHLQLLVDRSDMNDYLIAVLKSVLLFSSYELDDESVQRLASRMLTDAIGVGTIPCLAPEGQASAIDFANWIDSAVDTGRKSSQPQQGRVQEDEYGEDDEEFEDNYDEEEEEERGGRHEPSAPLSNLIPETPSLVLQDLRHIKASLGFVGFSAEDVMEHLAECSHAGIITLTGWLQVVKHMRQLDTDATATVASDYAMEIAKQIFFSVSELHGPVFSAGMERAVSYNHLLSAVSVLSDSPEEDKIAVAFMVLASSEATDDDGLPTGMQVISYNNVVNYFRGVLAVTCVCSPLVAEQIQGANISLDDLAVSGVNSAVVNAGLASNSEYFDMEEFAVVAWSCVQQ
jgi:hypothetical protein